MGVDEIVPALAIGQAIAGGEVAAHLPLGLAHRRVGEATHFHRMIEAHGDPPGGSCGKYGASRGAPTIAPPPCSAKCRRNAGDEGGIGALPSRPNTPLPSREREGPIATAMEGEGDADTALRLLHQPPHPAPLPRGEREILSLLPVSHFLPRRQLERPQPPVEHPASCQRDCPSIPERTCHCRRVAPREASHPYAPPYLVCSLYVLFHIQSKHILSESA